MLNNIKATNFMSWSNMDFPVTHGIKLIDGWNEDDKTSEGSGKSAILNALSWGAYGKLPKDTKIDDVIKDGEDSCEVILSFSNGESIVRSRKPNDLFIKKLSGSLVKGKDARETQEIIDEYLGMNFETFCQSVYFAQNYDKKFLPANQEEKGKILSNIQKLSTFDKARRETQDLLKIETEKQVSLKNQAQIEENNLKNVESQKKLILSFIEDKVNSHKKQVQTLISARDQHLKNIQETATEIEKLEAILNSEFNKQDLDNLEKSFQDRRPSLANKVAEVSYKKTQLGSIKRDILNKEQEGRSLANKYTQLQNKKQNSNIESTPTYIRLLSDLKRSSDYKASLSYVRLSSKKKDLEDFIKNPAKTCPSCGTELKNIDVTHIKQELSGVESEIQSIVNNSAFEVERISQDILSFETQFKKDLESIDVELSSILESLNVISLYLDSNKIPILEDVENEEIQLKNELSMVDKSLQDCRLKKSKIDRYESDLSLYVHKLKLDKDSYDKYEAELSQITEPDLKIEHMKMSVLLQQDKDLTLKLSQIRGFLFQSEQYFVQLEALKDGFKEIKSFVFGNALKELNFRANKYLSDLFEVEATIKFSTNEDQKIEYTIILDGQDRSLGLLSGGQNRRFNLAVDLALSDLVMGRKSTQLNVLILDEYFKDLSEYSMEKCLDLLKTRKAPVMLIEHNSIFKNIVDNVFFVQLKDGTSYESRS